MGVSEKGAGTFYKYVIGPLGAIYAFISLVSGEIGHVLLGLGAMLMALIGVLTFGTWDDD